MRFTLLKLLSAALLLLGTSGMFTVLAQAQDYMLDPRLPLPRTATVGADPYLFLPVEAGKDYQRLENLSPRQKQKMAHALGILLKARIMLEEKYDPAKVRESVSKADDEISDAAGMLPEESWLRKTLRGGAQALSHAWSLGAGSPGAPLLSARQRDDLIKLYKLEDIDPDHYQARVLAVARKFIEDAVTALGGTQIISPRWSEL